MKRNVGIGICIVIILLLGGFYRAFTDASSNAEISKISEKEYNEALKEYLLHPVVNGGEKEVNIPNEDVYYYKINVKDRGYSKGLPIDVEVFLLADKDYNFIDNSFFIISKPKDLTKSGYANTIIFLDKNEHEPDNVWLMVWVKGFFDHKTYKSIGYEYKFSSTFQFSTLKNLEK